MKRNWMISIIFSVLLFISITSAQLPQLEIIGNPQKSDQEFVGRMDANGRPCAAIQVLSNLDGFSYQAWNGVVGAIDDEQGKDIIYLQPDERVLEIYHTGFEPLKVILSDIGIQLSEKSVWILRIHGEKNPLPTDIVEGVPTPLKVTSKPDGAEIYLNNKRIGKTPFGQNIPSGIYDIKVEHDKFYASEDKLILVPGKNKNLNYELKPRLARVIVVSNPEAKIYIDNNAMKKGSLTKDLLIGSYEIKASMVKHEDAVDSVILKEGYIKELMLYPRPKYGTLTVEVSPMSAEGANLYIDGIHKGKIPNTFKDVFEGNHQIFVKKKGYVDYTNRINIKDKGSETLKIKLLSFDYIGVDKKIAKLNKALGDDLEPWLYSGKSFDGLSFDLFDAMLGPLMFIADPFVFIGSIIELDGFHAFYYGGKTALIYGSILMQDKTGSKWPAYTLFASWPFGITMYFLGKNHDNNLTKLNNERRNQIYQRIKQLEDKKKRYSKILNINYLGIGYNHLANAYGLTYSIPIY